MNVSRKVCALVFAASLCTAVGAGRAQVAKKEKSAESPFTVRLGARVLDARGRPVGGLRAEDFRVAEDGVPQKVTHFERLEGPHAFALVVDRSGSLRSDVGRVVEFGQLIVNGTGEDAAGIVVTFVDSDDIKVSQDATTDKRALSSALEDIFIEGGPTAINDAVHFAAERLAQFKRTEKSPRRYSLVLVTDGEDRASRYKDEQVFEKLRAAGLRLFVVGLVQRSYQHTTPEKAKLYMRRLASESGGSAYFFERGGDLLRVAMHILADMDADYLVGYEPTNQKRDGAERKVEVSVTAGPDGAVRKVLVKDGYVAPKKK
ncbi:MAG: VWA domain-containing protein [Acidobacteria bacterium]|nr:VWA domain-containing protein [Acidobacteriota bacterium]